MSISGRGSIYSARGRLNQLFTQLAESLVSQELSLTDTKGSEPAHPRDARQLVLGRRRRGSRKSDNPVAGDPERDRRASLEPKSRQHQAAVLAALGVGGR
jgi:hypothetical protein